MKIGKIEVKRPDNFQVYSDWLGRNLTRGAALLSYTCPHCKSTIFTDCAHVGELTDSLSTCPVCDGLYFKIVDNRGGYPVVTIIERSS